MLTIAWVLGLYFVNSLHDGIGNMFGKIVQQNPDFLAIGKENSLMSEARYSSNIIISMIGFVMWPHLFTKSLLLLKKE